MAKKPTQKDLNYLKSLLDGLFTQAVTPADERAAQETFWSQLGTSLQSNPQTRGFQHLDALANAIMDGRTDAILDDSVMLLPPLPPTPVPSLAAPQPSPSPLKRKAKTGAVTRSSSKRQRRSHSKSQVTTPPAPSSPPSAAQLADQAAKQIVVFAKWLAVSQSAPPEVQDAIRDVLRRSWNKRKAPWRLAYPWKDERLWYNPADFVYIYRWYWLLWNNHRPTFWRWAFHAPVDDAGQRRKAKYDATAARLQFMDLCIVTWGYFAFLEMLKDRDDLFCPMENLVKLWKRDKERYDYTIKHALDPANIDDYDYHHVTDILVDYGTLNIAEGRKYRLSDQRLARVRKDIMSAASQTVPPEWVGPKDEDPSKSLINSNRIKTVQDALYVKIKAGKFKPPTVPLVTEKEKDHSDFSDFEDDDGVATALLPASEEDDEEEEKENGVIQVDGDSGG
ncbi:hypothetical protein PHMEG_00029580 [Phytophthora megakarya]|uniref:Uncharacterized protein n=1 Tax=Phytophthora megakarya TaxID=4795 RepID=A0A225V0S0_9STRA|nr:hypothetical protein PHMEG_00029580 [Phytophthora megakarya]